MVKVVTRYAPDLLSVTLAVPDVDSMVMVMLKRSPPDVLYLINLSAACTRNAPSTPAVPRLVPSLRAKLSIVVAVSDDLTSTSNGLPLMLTSLYVTLMKSGPLKAGVNVVKKFPRPLLRGGLTGLLGCVFTLKINPARFAAFPNLSLARIIMSNGWLATPPWNPLSSLNQFKTLYPCMPK